jgi:hypothetical protein
VGELIVENETPRVAGSIFPGRLNNGMGGDATLGWTSALYNDECLIERLGTPPHARPTELPYGRQRWPHDA